MLGFIYELRELSTFFFFFFLILFLFLVSFFNEMMKAVFMPALNTYTQNERTPNGDNESLVLSLFWFYTADSVASSFPLSLIRSSDAKNSFRREREREREHRMNNEHEVALVDVILIDAVGQFAMWFDLCVRVCEIFSRILTIPNTHHSS